MKVKPCTGSLGPYWEVQFLEGQRVVFKWRRMGLGKLGSAIVEWAFNGRLPQSKDGPDVRPADNEEPDAGEEA